jgi:hypothetical protein
MTNLVTVRLSTNTFEALDYSRAFFSQTPIKKMTVDAA